MKVYGCFLMRCRAVILTVVKDDTVVGLNHPWFELCGWLFITAENVLWQQYHVMLKCSQWRYWQWRRQRSKGARSFWGQKILQPGHPDALFSWKKLTTFSSSRHQNTGRQRRFTVKIKQIKRSDMVTFLFSVPKQSNMQGGARAWARAVDLPARSFELARSGVAPPLVIAGLITYTFWARI